MTDTDELVGLWDSLPYAYGAMESSTIALLADGTGWSTWQNAVKGFELTLLTWSRESADAFTITEHQLVSGSWEPERHNELIATDPPMTLSTVTRLHYTLVRETDIRERCSRRAQCASTAWAGDARHTSSRTHSLRPHADALAQRSQQAPEQHTRGSDCATVGAPSFHALDR